MIAISDANGNDQLIYAELALPDGTFTVPALPKGSYTLSYFDITQLHILQFTTFTIPDMFEDTVYDLGKLYLTGWYTEIQGFFFIDNNENGIMDEGDEGLSSGPFPIVRLRDGTQIDRGMQFEVPFSDEARKGFYKLSHTYPLASWMTLHAYHPLWEMTGQFHLGFFCGLRNL
jgi:hypothetical protein